MGRKGVSKRKPKTKSKANSGGSAGARPGESATVQALFNKNEAPQLRWDGSCRRIEQEEKESKVSFRAMEGCLVLCINVERSQ
jgi:hypothetical protein